MQSEESRVKIYPTLVINPIIEYMYNIVRTDITRTVRMHFCRLSVLCKLTIVHVSIC